MHLLLVTDAGPWRRLMSPMDPRDALLLRTVLYTTEMDAQCDKLATAA